MLLCTIQCIIFDSEEKSCLCLQSVKCLYLRTSQITEVWTWTFTWHQTNPVLFFSKYCLHLSRCIPKISPCLHGHCGPPAHTSHTFLPSTHQKPFSATVVTEAFYAAICHSDNTNCLPLAFQHRLNVLPTLIGFTGCVIDASVLDVMMCICNFSTVWAVKLYFT